MAFLSKLQSRYARTDSERGAILVLTALVMMLLLFIAAFSTDLGAWYRQGQEQQRAADVGALNGVQAYDSAVKAYFAELEALAPAGVEINSWDDLTLAQQLEAEERGLRAAASTIIGLLETSGLSFSDPGSGVLAADPTDESLTSTWTIVADDGTQVIITRSFVSAGVDSMGDPITGRAIDVQVVAPGEQYFSNVLRDAPEIERSAQSVLSNCGAVCERTLTINPPFAGFSAASSGDGYAPLPFDADPSQPGFEEIWATNHHTNGSNNFHFLCFDSDAGAPCTGGNEKTRIRHSNGNRPVEYVHDGKIYYAAQEVGDANGGIGCFDMAARAYCATDFVELFPGGSISNAGWTRGSAYLGLHGPWEWNGNLYIVNQAGVMGCAVRATMQPCGTTTFDTLGTSRKDLNGNNVLPAATNGQHWVSHGEQLGSEVYLTHNGPGGVLFQCVDLNTRNSCWGGTTRWQPVLDPEQGGVGGDNNLTFLRYNTAQVPTQICNVQIESGNNRCYNVSNGNGGTSITGMQAFFQTNIGQHGSWGGDAFNWQDRRTFFAGGSSRRIVCWSWETGTNGAPCPGQAVVQTNNAFTGAGDARTYGFAQVTVNCLVALGHDNVFYSFNPVGLNACVDADVVTDIEPCECADGGNRWGQVRLPAELLNQVEELYATLSITDPNVVPGTTAFLPELDRVPLHLNGGVINLSNVPDSVDRLFLNLEVTAAIDLSTGLPEWTEPIDADLQISVQPTLTN